MSEVYQIIHRIKGNTGDLLSEEGSSRDSGRALNGKNDSEPQQASPTDVKAPQLLGYIFCITEFKFKVPGERGDLSG